MNGALPDGVVGADGLGFGVWKYVVVPGAEPRFASSDSGLQHKDLVQPGEAARAAGFIALSDKGEWLHVNATSESLGIEGDAAKDVCLLADAIGCPPLT